MRAVRCPWELHLQHGAGRGGAQGGGRSGGEAPSRIRTGGGRGSLKTVPEQVAPAVYSSMCPRQRGSRDIGANLQSMTACNHRHMQLLGSKINVIGTAMEFMYDFSLFYARSHPKPIS